MTPVEWPVVAPPFGQGAPTRVPARARLETVRRDFFLNPEERLSEQERALMDSILRTLVNTVAAELRAHLPAGWTGANEHQDEDELFDRMMVSRALDQAAIIENLLNRAADEGAATAAVRSAHRGPLRLIQSLVGHENGPVAATAMALVMARGRRRDRFGQCLLDLDDFDQQSARVIVSAIAVTLRSAFIVLHGSAATDRALVDAIDSVLRRHDPQRGLEPLTDALVGLLDSAGGLTDSLLAEAANEGEMSFVAHALARRCGIDVGDARAELLSGDPRRVMMLLRMSGANRALVATMLGNSNDALGMADAAQALSLFDALGDDQVDAARSWFSAPASYRSAVLGEEPSNG